MTLRAAEEREVTRTDTGDAWRVGLLGSHLLIAGATGAGKGSVLWGLVLMVVAAGFLGSQEAILKVGLKVLTWFYGALLGVFLVGILTRRGTSASAVAGRKS